MMWLGNSFILGFALAMDCFALSIADGLVFGDIKKRKYFFIAGVFGVFQGLMPLIGFYWARFSRNGLTSTTIG